MEAAGTFLRAEGGRNRDPGFPPPPQCLHESYEDPRTEEELSGDDEQNNGCRLNELAPEVARHHQLRKQACSGFESLPPSHARIGPFVRTFGRSAENGFSQPVRRLARFLGTIRVFGRARGPRATFAGDIASRLLRCQDRSARTRRRPDRRDPSFQRGLSAGRNMAAGIEVLNFTSCTLPTTRPSSPWITKTNGTISPSTFR